MSYPSSLQAIFLVGEQRSGSNLLRLMISNSPAIAAPHPPHILQRIDPIVPVSEILDEPRFETLIETVCRLVETNPVPWLNTALHRSEVRRRCREKHVIAIYGAVMDIHAESNGAHTWMCKSMQNVRWAPALDAYFRDSKYIYLHRDARDVALSFTKAIVGDKHVYFIAKQWAELQRLCLSARRAHDSNRFTTVSYVDITQNAVSTLRGLCSFLGVPFRTEMMQFYDSEEARNTAGASSLWENVVRPLMHDNHQKYLRELSEAQIRLIESVTGSQLDELGYGRVFVEKGREQVFSEEDIVLFREENERLKKLKAEHTDAADAEKRRHQEQVLVELRRALQIRPRIGG
jgi:hypothetical protein